MASFAAEASSTNAHNRTAELERCKSMLRNEERHIYSNSSINVC